MIIFLFLLALYAGKVELSLFSDEECIEAKQFWGATLSSDSCTDLSLNGTMMSIKTSCVNNSLSWYEGWKCENETKSTDNTNQCNSLDSLFFFNSKWSCGNSSDIIIEATTCDNSIQGQLQTLPISGSNECVLPQYRQIEDEKGCVCFTDNKSQCCSRFNGEGAACYYGENLSPDQCMNMNDIVNIMGEGDRIDPCPPFYSNVSYTMDCCKDNKLLLQFFESSKCDHVPMRRLLLSEPGCYSDLFSQYPGVLFSESNMTHIDWACATEDIIGTCEYSEVEVVDPDGCCEVSPTFAPTANTTAAPSAGSDRVALHVWAIILLVGLLLLTCFCCGAGIGEVTTRTYGSSMSEFDTVSDFTGKQYRLVTTPRADHNRAWASLQASREPSWTEDANVDARGFHWPSYFIMLCTIFSMAMEFGILLPTCWTYVQQFGKDEVFLGAALALYSAGRAIGFPIFGIWADKRPMVECCTFGFIFGILGNVVYGLAGYFEHAYFIMLGRFLAGVGSAVVSASIIYIQRTTSEQDRLKYVNYLSLAFLLGGVIGPACNAIYNDLDEQIWIFKFTVETMAGYLMAVVNLLLLFALWFFFKEPPNPIDHMPRNFSKCERIRYRLIHKGGWYNYIMQYFIGIAIAGTETALPIMMQERFGWGTSSNSAGFAYIGVCVIVGAILLHVLNKRKFNPKMCVLIGLVYMCVAWGWAIVIFTRETYKSITIIIWLFLFFTAVVPVMNASRGLFTLIIGNDEYKGTFTAWASMMVCFGRISGCLMAGSLKGYDLEKYYWITLTAMFCIAFLCFGLAWPRIQIESKGYTNFEDK